MGLFNRKKKEPTANNNNDVNNEVKKHNELSNNDNSEQNKSQKKFKDLNIDKNLESELKEINRNAEIDKKINEEELNKIDSSKDITREKKKKQASKVYDYWVWIFKDDRRIYSFGVNKEEYAGVELLIRREERQGQKKVIFRELFPESGFDLNSIRKNRKKIKEDLDKLKQIERKLEENLLSNSPKKYNYDLADVKLKIQQKEIWLQSIRYGVITRYIHYDFRDDGIPVIMYDMENSELRLRKYVKESNIYTTASEGKKIENHDAKAQIDHELKKKTDRDWQRIIMTFMWIILLGIGCYGVFELLKYNEDKAFADTKNQFSELIEQQNNGVEDLMDKIGEGNVVNEEELNKLIEQNNEILKQCAVEEDGDVPSAEE
ncbi:MAG: hypothetical protein ACOC56_01320 [Atribacterota bacterium]